MHLLKSRSIRFCLGFFLLLVLNVGGSVGAFADSSTGATVAVNAGNLSEAGPVNVSAGAVTLDGTDQTTSYAPGLTVTDARGNRGGWDLTITSKRVTEGRNVRNNVRNDGTSGEGARAA